MEDYQQRVIDEKEELDSKVKKLQAFVNGEQFNTLSAAEQERMSDQLRIMQEYSRLLGDRINAFQ